MEMLHNSNVVVAIAFFVFVGVLIYVKVPGKLAAALDARAEGIRAQLDEAKAFRDEAQNMLAEVEQKLKGVESHSRDVIAQARVEAERDAEKAKADLARSIERRLKSAADQIAAAEGAAVKEVRDRAISIATEVAAEVMRAGLSAKSRNAMTDASIKDVAARLN